MEAAQGVLAYGGEGVGVAVGAGCGVLDELRLGAGAKGRGDHGAGDGGGGLGPVGEADQVEAEVDADGGGAYRGPDIAVLDEQRVGFHGDLGVAGLKVRGEVPVGDGAAAVEESGAGEDEGAGAEGGDRGARVVGAAQGVEDGGGDRGVVVDQARDDDQVGVVQPVEGTVGGEGEAARHRDRVAGGGGGAAQFEGRDSGKAAFAAPDLGDDGDVEGADAGEGDEGDALHASHDGRVRALAGSHRCSAFLPLVGRGPGGSIGCMEKTPVEVAGNAALVVVDVQKGFEDPFWGRRNNPDAERNITVLIDAWQESGRPVVFVRHDSPEQSRSPLRVGYEGNDFKDVVEERRGKGSGPELLVRKSVNSAFYGEPDLDGWLKGAGVRQIVIA